MTEEHKKLIRAKTDIIIDTLDLNSTLLARLRSRNVLLSGDVSRINEGNGDGERVQIFLNIFLKKPDSAFRELVLALRDPMVNQKHVAKILDRNRGLFIYLRLFNFFILDFMKYSIIWNKTSVSGKH